MSGYYKGSRMKGRERNQRIVNAIKLDRGCEADDCGWRGDFTPQMLHFDHVVPVEKEHAISYLVKHGRAVDTLMKEIDKCVVLCACCHAKKSYEEGDHYGSV